MFQIRYFAMTDEHDEVTQLGKVVENDLGLFGYLLYKGQWLEERLVLQCLFDQSVGEEISEADAARLAKEFGGAL
jgi:hypothetical protein